MTYSLLNKKVYGRSFQVHVESAFCPSCLEAMNGGIATLKYWTDADTVSNVVPGVKAVVNVATGHSLEYEFTTQPAALYGEETLFGLELNPRFIFPNSLADRISNESTQINVKGFKDVGVGIAPEIWPHDALGP